MNSKAIVAGAIVALIALCAVAAVALSLGSPGQPPQSDATCKVSGYVVSSFGQGLPGLDVTLHVMGDAPEGQVKELYYLTTTTKDALTEGQYVFENVPIPAGTKFAYVETSKKVGDITTYGRSNNLSLTTNGNISMSIVLMLPPTQ